MLLLNHAEGVELCMSDFPVCVLVDLWVRILAHGLLWSDHHCTAKARVSNVWNDGLG